MVALKLPADAIDCSTDDAFVCRQKVRSLLNEANEIVAMTAASIKTLRPGAIQNLKSKV